MIDFKTGEEPWYHFDPLECQTKRFNISLMAVNEEGMATEKWTEMFEIDLSEFQHAQYIYENSLCSYNLFPLCIYNFIFTFQGL